MSRRAPEGRAVTLPTAHTSRPTIIRSATQLSPHSPGRGGTYMAHGLVLGNSTTPRALEPCWLVTPPGVCWSRVCRFRVCWSRVCRSCVCRSLACASPARACSVAASPMQKGTLCQVGRPRVTQEQTSSATASSSTYDCLFLFSCHLRTARCPLPSHWQLVRCGGQLVDHHPHAR